MEVVISSFQCISVVGLSEESVLCGKEVPGACPVCVL